MFLEEQLIVQLLLDKQINNADISKINQALLIKLLNQHQVSPLIYHKMRTNKVSTAKLKSVVSELQKQYSLNLIRQSVAEADFFRLAHALFSHKVDFIPLKGFVFSHLYYPDPYTRPFRDIDLLFKEEQWPEIVEAMKTAGYKLYQPKNPKLKLVEADVLEHTHFVNGRFNVEVHFDWLQLGLAVYLNTEVWQKVQTWRFNQFNLKILSPELTLIQALVHLNKHSFERLIWFYDIYLLVNSIKINWLEFRALVKESQLQAPVYLSLNRVAEVMQLKIPVDLLEPIKPNFLKTQVWQNIWPAEKMFRCFINEQFSPLIFAKGSFLSRKNMLNLLLTGKLKEKIKYWLKKLLPSKQFLAAKNPGQTSYSRNYLKRIQQRLNRMHN